MKALLAGGRAWLLPSGCAPLSAVATRALPGGAGWLGMLGGRAVPVLAPGGVLGAAWLSMPGPGGAFLVTGDAVLEEVPEGASPLILAPLPAPPPAAPAVVPPPEPAAPRPDAGPAMLELSSPGGRFVVPLPGVVRVVPLPGCRAIVAAPPAVLGWAQVEDAPVLIADPGGMAGGAQHLVLLDIDGRLLGVPCARLAPVAAGTPGSDLRGLAGLLGWAPPHRVATPVPPVPTRGLLIAQAAGQRFALAAAEVEAAIAPLHPTAFPGGRRAIVHRGLVLPVLDAGPALGGGAACWPAPFLRLRLPAPIALAITAVEGLRQLPETAIAPLDGDAAGPVIAIVTLPGGTAPVPLLSAWRLAG
ncbi:chemotaxis protein CheW [Humitalea sp. 24SJ18S-53]|uniref:chemotaxis protein CheW n=1 Tax=Humitalea sp. 24SJ18S-53 TaxID=3422307 RepID=UPI003D66BEBB